MPNPERWQKLLFLVVQTLTEGWVACVHSDTEVQGTLSSIRACDCGRPLVTGRFQRPQTRNRLLQCRRERVVRHRGQSYAHFRTILEYCDSTTQLLYPGAPERAALRVRNTNKRDSTTQLLFPGAPERAALRVRNIEQKKRFTAEITEVSIAPSTTKWARADSSALQSAASANPAAKVEDFAINKLYWMSRNHRIPVVLPCEIPQGRVAQLAEQLTLNQ